MADNFTETPVRGKRTHNTAVPGNGNVGVLAGIATNVAPTYTEGNLVGLSTDLAGALRVVMAEGAGTSTVDISAASLAALETIQIGSIAAGDNNIGNVDIASMPAITGTVALDAGTLTALENTTVTVGNASLAVTGTFWQATQPVSIASTVNVDLDSLNGTAIATGAGVVNAGTQRVHLSDESLAALETTSISGSVAVTGPLTDAQLRATPVPVDISDASVAVTGTFWQATQPVSGTVEIGATSLAALETITVSNTSFGISGSLPAGTNNIGDVDILTLPAVTQGTSAAVSAPWYVRLSDGAAAVGTAANPLVVTYNESGAGTIADSGLLTTASVAAGGSTTFNSTTIAAGTGRLIELTASASVRLKIEFQTYNGTVATTRRVFFTEAHQHIQYAPKDIDSLTLTGAAGATFRMVVTNMDPNQASDVYASMTWTA